MTIDASYIPVSPTFMLTCAVIGVVFAFGIAPEIARREMAQSNWHVMCEADVSANIVATRKPARVLPQVPDLCGIIGGAFPEFSELCAMVPDPNAAAKEAERRLQEAETARIQRTTAGVVDRCFCAETLYIENERLSLALYALTARQITPSSVKNREAMLSRTLHSTACKMEG
jgi:hypothetical protein